MSNQPNQMNPSSLHVPNSTISNAAGVKSIMDAYKTQSKIQLYDDNSAMSSNDISGVSGRDIPLEALRPHQVVEEEVVDEYGNVRTITKEVYAAEASSRSDIRKAYMRMNGMDENHPPIQSRQRPQQRRRNRLEDIQEAEIEYIEDVPDDNEGLLNYLETCINNAKANLEMLESLYAALS